MTCTTNWASFRPILEGDLKALSPADGPIVDELLAAARAMRGLDMSQIGLGKPAELASPWDQAKELWAMRRLLRYALGKHGQPVAAFAQRVQDPTLRTLLRHRPYTLSA